MRLDKEQLNFDYDNYQNGDLGSFLNEEDSQIVLSKVSLKWRPPPWRVPDVTNSTVFGLESDRQTTDPGRVASGEAVGRIFRNPDTIRVSENSVFLRPFFSSPLEDFLRNLCTCRACRRLAWYF